MKQLNMYAVTCYVPSADRDTPDTITCRQLVPAESVGDALDGVALWPMPANRRIAAYPAVIDGNDGAGMIELARYTQRSELRWRLRNSHAVGGALMESQWAIEDCTSIATLAIAEYYSRSPNGYEHNAYCNARRAVSAERTRMGRKSEREYLPGWSVCNPFLAERQATANALPATLARAVEDAIMRAGLRDRQSDIINGIMASRTPAEICELCNISKDSYKQAKRGAFARIAKEMLNMPGFVQLAAECGFSGSELLAKETLEELVKRAKTANKNRNKNRKA